METKFKTRENAKPSKPEVNNLPSQTIPDASISMRQILDRFQRGIPVTRTLRTPQYNEDFNYSDNMEFDDIHTAKLEQLEKVEKLNIRKREIEKIKQAKKANNDSQENQVSLVHNDVSKAFEILCDEKNVYLTN